MEKEKLLADLNDTDRVAIIAYARYAKQLIKGAGSYFISTLLHKEPNEKGVMFLCRVAEAIDLRRAASLVWKSSLEVDVEWICLRCHLKDINVRFIWWAKGK
jgi:hypothetical protein